MPRTRPLVPLGHTGHEFVENKGPKTPKKVKLAQRKLSLKLEEMEAETVAFLVCQYVGLVAPSPTYLAGYIDDEKDWLDFSYETVIKVADRLQGMLISRLQRTNAAMNNRQAVDGYLVVELRAYEIVHQYLNAGITSFISICTDIYQQHGMDTLQSLFRYLKGAYGAAQTQMEEGDFNKSDQNIRNIAIEEIVMNASKSAG